MMGDKTNLYDSFSVLQSAITSISAIARLPRFEDLSPENAVVVEGEKSPQTTIF